MRQLSRRLVAAALSAAVLLTAASAAAPRRFSDVPAGCWAADSIRRCVDAGLFQGETATRFGLGRTMTRAAFAVVLCRLFRWETAAPERGSYTDNQNPQAWYYAAVETARSHGALTAQDDSFRPNDPVTREEMAVMLVRALGLSSIAGLDQGLPQPFRDVTTNGGYIAMAARLGIVSGTSPAVFSPNRAAAREEAAVMLMRVYDRYYAASETLGLLPGSGSAELSGCGAVGVGAARFTASGAVAELPARELRTAAKAAGARALLVIGGTAVPADPSAAAQAAAAAAADWDGVLLDLRRLDAAGRAGLTALAKALREALGEKLLYMTAEAPAAQAVAYGGYDYAALSAAADRLILRPASYEKSTDDFPTAPREPLEEVYYALAALPAGTDRSKLSVWLTSDGCAWRNTRADGSRTAGQIAALLSGGADVLRSARYATCCLTSVSGGVRTTVWFHDAQAREARAQLVRFFGGAGLCVSDLRSVPLPELPS
jgi:hypothetical protein